MSGIGVGSDTGTRQVESAPTNCEARKCETRDALKNISVLKISDYSLKEDQRPYAKVEICDEEIYGLLDSGANVTILGKGAYERVRKWKLELVPIKLSVRTADGAEQKLDHRADVPFHYAGQRKVVSALLIESITRPLILGIDFWKAFGIFPSCEELETVALSQRDECTAADIVPPKPETVYQEHDLGESERNILSRTVKLFPFADPDEPLSCTKLIKHKIDTESSAPFRAYQYAMSPYILTKVRAEIERMLRKDIIERIESPTWINPVLPVPKPNGTIRLCLDARKLNAVTVKAGYPQQNYNRILSLLSGTKYLSAIDLTDAFYQIELDPVSRPKTAFAISALGSFQYKRMPMGLCNSGSTLCELIDRLFGVEFEPHAFPYLDDFIVATEEFDCHISVLEKIAARLKSAGLTISPTKSKFCMQRLKFVGHIIDGEGIKPDMSKIQPIVEYPPPTSVKDVRRLLGMVGWYRRFIPNFSSITAPISELLKKNKLSFKWTDEAQNAFVQVRSALTSEPVLTTPKYDLPFFIQTDASDIGLGAVLFQVKSGNEYVVAYHSAKLTPAQRKYHVTERECLAVLSAIEKFRPYVEGTAFTVITDHASLLWLSNLKDPTGRLARWALRLQSYDFTLVHRKGKNNVVPDALSRAFNVDLIDLSNVAATKDEWYAKTIKTANANGCAKMGYKYENNVLFYNVKRGYQASHYGWKICVPKEYVLEVLRSCHDEPTAAHAGYFRTLCRVKDRYFWPKMDKDVRAYVGVCSVCKASKATNRNETAPMGNFREPLRPFHILSLDYIGPLPLSKKGSRFILVVVDLFSKFVFIKPLRKSSAQLTIAYLREEVFRRYGVPQYLISDNGPQLRSEAFTKFLEEHKTTHWLTAVYHPQSNPTEAANKTIVTAIRSYIEDNHSHNRWDEYVSEITFALNSSVHSTTKNSPHSVLFGYQLAQHGSDYANVDHDPERKNKLEVIRLKVSKALQDAHEKNKRRYDLRSREISYLPGETVYRQNTKLSDGGSAYSAKLAPKYVQCTIVRKTGTNTYETKDVDGNHTGVYHTNFLKK